MCPHPKPNLSGAELTSLDRLDLGTQVLLDASQEGIVVVETLGDPHAWQVLVAGAVSEPAPHLKKGVVGVRCAREVRNDQAFEGETS